MTMQGCLPEWRIESGDDRPRPRQVPMNDASLRALLIRLLDWQDAHIHIDDAVEGIATDFRGVRPEGTPYSAWELLEHMRLAQWDILDFCRNPEYEEQKWPDDYWPDEPAPESEAAWNECLASFRADRESLKVLAKDSDLELFAEIPHGTGQTYIRELLLVADHTAYHVGQLVLVRRLLGIWPG